MPYKTPSDSRLRRICFGNTCKVSEVLCHILLGLVSCLLISACSGGLFSSPPLHQSASSSTDCHMVEHVMGETCVPNNPQRVVVLGGLDYALSLGVKPIGSNELEADLPHLKDKIEGIENVGNVIAPNLEKILQLKPDFILSSQGGLKANYNTLSKIAPTVIFPFEHSEKWKEMLTHYAQALGKTDVAKQVMADYNARLETFKDQMGERLNQLEVSIVRIYPNQIVVYLKDSFCGTILADAGVSRPAHQNQMGGQQDISKERIHDLDGDVMFVWTYGYNAEIAQQANITLEKLKTDSLWSQLKVVKQDTVYEVPGYWIGEGPLAADAIIDDLFKYLVDNPNFNPTL